MSTSSQKIRAWKGAAILGFGFRPFFLSAAILAALAMVIWIPLVTGAVALPVAYGPLEWHAHEFLWGYVSAAVAGFLLTAVPNWTGRLPIAGYPLGALWLLWIAGRAAMLFGGALPFAIPAVVDASFLVVFAAVVAREIIAGANWRNLKVLIVLSLLAASNILFHVEALQGQAASGGYGLRLGLASAILLVALIGGRIVPSFTRNWLARRGPGRLPVEFGRADMIAVAITGIALALWVALPDHPLTGIAALIAGLTNLWRLSRWAGDRTLAEPLVTILHVGFLFVPLGFLMLGAAALWPDLVPRPAAQHAWMAGAIAVMTLAVMTRASLGHSGRDLTAGRGITAIYVLAVAAALARIVYGLAPGALWLLHTAGLLWIAGFALFAVIYAPLLTQRR